MLRSKRGTMSHLLAVPQYINGAVGYFLPVIFSTLAVKIASL